TGRLRPSPARCGQPLWRALVSHSRDTARKADVSSRTTHDISASGNRTHALRMFLAGGHMPDSSASDARHSIPSQPVVCILGDCMVYVVCSAFHHPKSRTSLLQCHRHHRSTQLMSQMIILRVACETSVN